MKTNLVVLTVSAVIVFGCATEGGGTPAGRAGKIASAPVAGNVAAVRQSEAVSLTTSDGVIITGTFYAAGPKAPAVLCLHQWRSDRNAFAGLASEMQKAGITVLAIDLRGHGGSVRSSTGGAVSADRNAMADVAAGVEYLRGNRAADPERIGLIGASYGASNAVMYAAEDGRIAAVALLSPGLNYFNVLPIEPSVTKYKGSMLAVAGREDVRSADAVRKIRDIAKGRAATQLYDNAGHGTDMLEAGVGLQRTVIEFFKTNL